MGREKSGQNLTELSILVVVLALGIGMQLYVQRGLQARYKEGVDYLNKSIKAKAADPANLNNEFENFDFAHTPSQYEPYYRTSSFTTSTNSDTSGGFPDSSIDETTHASGWEREGLP